MSGALVVTILMVAFGIGALVWDRRQAAAMTPAERRAGQARTQKWSAGIATIGLAAALVALLLALSKFLE